LRCRRVKAASLATSFDPFSDMMNKQRLLDFLDAARADLLAGVAVFLVALPLCLGIATASGAGPVAGIVSGVIGGVVVACASRSRFSVSGPAAGLVAIVAQAVIALGYPAFLLALCLAGGLQCLFGAMRAGRFASYVPGAVIQGMLAAIGLLLVIGQLPVAAGMLGANGAALAVSPSCVALCLVALAILVGWESPALVRFRLLRMVPAPLMAVSSGVVLTWLADRYAPGVAPGASHRIALPAFEGLMPFLASLDLPDATRFADPAVWKAALTIAVVASLETLLSIEAIGRIAPGRDVPAPDRELFAQGLGNCLAGALGALPVTSVIVRSSVNIHAGARSRAAAVVHGLLLAASVALLVPLLNLVPLPSLAAVLLHTGYKLARPAMVLAMYRKGADTFLPFAVTVAAALATDMLRGIACGIGCAMLWLLRANLHAALTLTRHENHYLLRLRKDLSFLSKARLQALLRSVQPGSVLIVDAGRIDMLDPDVCSVLEEFTRSAPERDIVMEFRDFPAVKGMHGGFPGSAARRVVP
jgi:MFS superfamily sulfate permease-like transporter